MQSKNIGYLPAVDQLRGIAALLILFYHGLTLISYELIHQSPFAFDRWLHAKSALSAVVIEGHTAVALFMVLSGFIFTIGTLDAKIDYRQFITNRFFRTYPLFVVMIFAGMHTFPENFSFSALLQNLLFLGNAPGSNNGAPFTTMFWAVAVEWQFYLLFPFLIRFLNHSGVRILFGILLVFLILRCLCHMSGADTRDLSYYTILGRMDQFLIGMLTGVVYRQFYRPGIAFDLLFVLSAIVVVAALYGFNQLGGWPAEGSFKILWPTLEGLLWAGFILGYLSISRWLWPYATKLLSAIGIISYSIYLIHFVVITLCIEYQLLWAPFEDRHVLNALLSTSLIALPLALAISTLTYQFIEKPFLDMRRVYKRPGIVPA